ncbi:serine hydrolase [Imperialibacter roseus]|uniref:Serine hydrolase n=1 Tax=Imperialibacter roseus TaxID=1324217 RepID=A0ABZ0IPY6_9BACT|nr:serine hydrolase [Imperialibacter roseus]WOK07113.1 serine hydrolase [Imperialibacter roseus]|tara:strand:+ start:25823 stop:26923 length:1101 start_codon:yes stop_codon:yes gene_type:complete
MRKNLLPALGLLLVTHFAVGQKVYQYAVPPQQTDRWETENLLQAIADTTLLFSFFNKMINEDHQVHSILLVKDGKLVLEEYFGEHKADQTHDLRSATKSIRSLLVGIAIDKGFIESVDDPIFKYLKSPEPQKNIDARKEQITIRHLLTMSTGLDCNDWDKSSKGQEDKVYKKKDWLQYTLDLPMVRDPGDSALYCSMGVVLAAEVVSQASGMSIDAFAEKYLFAPLGIENVQWGHTTTGRDIIPSGKRLYMTSRDFAKIGQLVMNHGAWSDQQIVSAGWIQQATERQTNLAGLDYGFLWWSIPFQIGDELKKETVATGNGGQYLMLFPELKLVAAFTGGAYNSDDDKFPFAIMNRVLLPQFVEANR